MLSKSGQKLVGQKIMSNFAAVYISKPIGTKIDPYPRLLSAKQN